MLDQIVFNIEVIFPIFLIVVVGVILRYFKIIDSIFITKTNLFVFKVALPALLFQKVAVADFSHVFQYDLLIISIVVTVFQFLISWFVGSRMNLAPEDKGVFIQGAFRSNFAILGLAVLFNIYGDTAVGKASIVLAFVMPLYNLLGVISLLLPHQDFSTFNLKQTLKDIFLNPLVLGIVFAIPFSTKLIALPEFADKSISYISAIALPLALINIGGTLELKNLSRASGNAFISSMLKIVAFPAIFIPLAAWLGFMKDDLVILFILFGSPTAIASFIMAGAMKGNVKLAGNIVVISTMLSVLTLSIGLGLINFIFN